MLDFVGVMCRFDRELTLYPRFAAFWLLRFGGPIALPLGLAIEECLTGYPVYQPERMMVVAMPCYVGLWSVDVYRYMEGSKSIVVSSFFFVNGRFTLGTAGFL